MYKKISVSVFSLFILLLGFVFVNSVLAAPEGGTTTVTDITGGSFGGGEGLNLKQASDPQAILKIQTVPGDVGKTLNSVEISFTSTAGTPTWTSGGADSSELLDLTTTGGGFSLWKESSGGISSSFSSTSDTEIPLATSPVYGGSSNFILTPATPPTLGMVDIYYVVVKSDTSGLTSGNAFTVTMGANALTYSSASPTITPVTTQNITIDTTAPTLSTGSSFPQNNATGVPVSTFMNMQFSENMDFSTITPSNISVTTGGSPVGNSIRSMPNGFNLIISNPPTYTVGSRFAKIPNTSFGFFNIFGTSPIMSNGGSYITPALGDIVLFQHDTFPAQFGIVTNATMTGGTFSINDFTLQGGQAITKFTPVISGTGIASSTIGSLSVGDIIMANTSANPTTDRYGWHVVTTAGAVNGSEIRLDGASSAPVYASGSRYSKFATGPGGTSSVDNSNIILGNSNSIRFTTGDLIFAKVTENADNLDEYAFHNITVGEDISTDTLPSALRLDGADSAPTFAANSQISVVISPSTHGLVTDTTTTLNFGDVLFAKTTADSAVNGRFDFHLVSNSNMGADGLTSSQLRFDNSSAALLPSTLYSIVMGTGLKDKAGNPLASTQTVNFTTGSTTNTNTTPPIVIASTPQNGMQSFPTSGSLTVQFSVPMIDSGPGSVLSSSNIGLYTDNFGGPGTPVASTLTYSSATNTVTINPDSDLSLSTGYLLKVEPTTTSATGTALQGPFFMHFMTASATDNTAPTVVGSFPYAGASNVTRSLGAINIGFSEDIDGGTVCSTTCVTLSGGITGTTSYNPQNRTIYFAPNTLLAASTTYTVTVSTDITDLAGNPLAVAYTSTFTTDAGTDVAPPSVAFANADNFGVAVTFNEPMKLGGGPSAADNISNYTLESPVGSSIALDGKTVTYDGATMTAKINGLSLQNGNTFKVIVRNITQDLAGNSISTSGSPAGNIGVGTVYNSSDTGGDLGPGGGGDMDFGQQGVSPIGVYPMNRSIGRTSNYGVEFPITNAIPSGGSIVLTFPVGFEVGNAVAATAGTESFRNNDLNGPASGTPTIASVTGNSQARTITIVTGGASTGSNTFIALDLKGIVNSTVPTTTGYTVDIKTRDTAGNNNAVLETKTSGPFFLGAAGANTVSVNVFKDLNSDGIKDSGEEIQNAKVFLFSPQTGGQELTTNSSGEGSFTYVADGDYEIGLNPASLTSANISFNSAPQHINITGNITKNFALSATTLSISGTVTGPASTDIDVFAMSPNGFAKTTVTLTGGADAYSLPVGGNTTYQLGVGPAIPEGSFVPGSLPPPPPVFTFMPPPNIQVAVEGVSVTGKNFTLSTANRTLTGTVKDNTNTGINGVQVFARPVGASTTGGTGSAVGFGVGAKTDSSGNFTLNIVDGVYVVEAFKPGFPAFPQKQVTVAVGGNTPSTLAFVANAVTTLTISGTIKDASGNAVPFSGISARKVTSTTDTTPLGGGSQNFVGGQSDSNGSYTLYVDAGTWVVEAFAPGLGRLGSKTLTVSTTSLSGQDFSAETLNLGTISGTASKDSVSQQGVMVRADSASGANMAVTNASGAYSLKVPAGSYTVKCFFPGVGESAPLTSVSVTANTTTSGQDCTLASPITITVNLTDGTNPIQNAFVDVRDSNGRGNGTNINTTSGANATYVINVPPGTYTVRANHPAYGQIGTTTAVNTTRSITYTASAGSLVAVTGNVTGSGSPLGGAWVSLRGTPTGQTNIIMTGAQTTALGTFSISVPAGVYNIRADKPGYKSPAEGSVTVSGATVSAGTIALTTASRTITGTITISSAGVSNAWVDATNGSGGFTVAQTDAAGAYSLPVENGTWSVRAHAHGYEGGPLEVIVNDSNPSSQNIALSAISGFTLKPERQETLTPTAGGFFTNSDIGANFKLTIPANALGTGSNANTVTTKENTSMPTPQDGISVLSEDGVTISAVDSSGAPVTSLNDDVTIVIPYTLADLPVGAVEDNLQIASWNTATNQYDTLSTAVDTVNHTLTAITSHFSDFAPLVPTSDSESIPGTPTGLAVGSETTTTLALSWTQTSGATSYDIYRSTTSGGTYARLGSEPTVSSGSTVAYSDTGLTSGTTYYYKISALNSSGESAASSAVSGTTTNSPTTTTSGSRIIPPVFNAPATPPPSTPSVVSSPQISVVYNLGTVILKNGSRGEAVKELQRFLNDTMKLGLVIDGMLGPKTIAVMKQWQKDNGLVSDGLIGPKTKALINSKVQ